ncbi:MAG: hypothetical protein ACK5JS_05535 [Mangrovibacterium sp.]
MKKLLYIIVSATLLTFTACEQDVPGVKNDSYESISLMANIADVDIKIEEGFEIKFPIYRSSTNGGVNSVAVALKDTNNIFELESDIVSFPADSYVGYATIKPINPDLVSLRKSSYKMILEITDKEYLNGVDTTLITATPFLTFTDTIGTGALVKTDAFWGANNVPNVLKMEGQNIYQAELYLPGFPMNIFLNDDGSVTILEQNTGFEYTTGAYIYMYSVSDEIADSLATAIENPNTYEIDGDYIKLNMAMRLTIPALDGYIIELMNEVYAIPNVMEE